MEANRRQLWVSPEIFVMMFQQHDLPKFYSVTKDALPLDARIVDVEPRFSGDDTQLTALDLTIESEEFNEDTPDPLPPIEVQQQVAIVATDVFVTEKEEPSGEDKSDHSSQGQTG